MSARAETGPESAMVRARAASEAWGALPVGVRASRIKALQQELLAAWDEVVALGRVAGKPVIETVTGDLLPTLDTLGWVAEHAPSLLADEKRAASTLHFGRSFEVEFAPVGVVLVLAPWNFPIQLALVPAAHALAAGNAVIVKPSEVVPESGALLRTLAARAGFPEDVFQVVDGDGSVGEALVRARPDRVFFTGSTATGRKVAKTAAELLVPVDLELGGKDAMVVLEDADLDRAVHGAVHGAFANAGQVCVSIERAFVARPLFDRFVAGVADAVRSLKVGTGPDDDVGPLVSDRQRDIVQEQLRAALEAGARAVTPVRIEGRLVFPVVLTDVTPSMAVMREETFGPVLPIVPFDTEDEAVRLANDTDFGLGASVWTRDVARGKALARRLRAGHLSINDSIVPAGNPSTPFGGLGASGFGRSHGAEGLRAFTRPRTIAVAARRSRENYWYPRAPGFAELVRRFAESLFGEGLSVKRGARFAAVAVRNFLRA